MRSQRFLPSALISIGLFAAVPVFAAPVVVNFENDADLGLFTQRIESTNTGTLPMWAQDPAAGPFNGVNGSRGVTLTGGGTVVDSTLVYTGPGAVQSLGVGDTATLSTLFRRNANTASGVYAQLGLLGNDAASYGFYGTPTTGLPDVSFISLRLRSTEAGAATTATDRLELQTRNFPAAVANTTIDANGVAAGTDFTLTEGNWYEYLLTFTKSAAADQFLWTANLLDRGATGTAVGTPVFPAGLLTGTITGVTNIYGDSSLYAGIRSATRTQGLGAIDNFAVNTVAVPEPATLAGVALFGIGLLTRRSCRRA